MKSFLSCLLLTIPCLLMAQFRSYPLQDSLPTDARVYHLPQTALNIQFRTQCIVEQPGELSRYAERFLGISEQITEESCRYEITDIKVDTYNLADPAMAFYLVEETPSSNKSFSKNALSEENLRVTCTQEGILLAVNADIPNALKPKAQPLRPKFRPEAAVALPSQAYLTQEMKLANSSLKMAELAARQIFSIRETRLALLHGELENYPQDGEAFKLFLKELNYMEQQYLELFLGKRIVTEQSHSVQFIPEKGQELAVVCRLSSQKGIVDADDLSGRPIYCKINLDNKALAQKPDSVTIPGKKRGEFTRMEEAPALYYYYPQSAQVQLIDGGQCLWQKNLILAQMGHLLRLKAENQLSVVMNPSTGAIVER